MELEKPTHTPPATYEYFRDARNAGWWVWRNNEWSFVRDSDAKKHH